MTLATDNPVPAAPALGQRPAPTLHYISELDLGAAQKSSLAAAVVQRTTRTAVLVIHGIGSQKPYTTLDQFARGLRRFFGPHATQEVLLRPREADANTGEKAWVQAYVRITPAPHANGLIDLYEYYWAPVITGKVSAYQSLLFLLMAALTPLQYLRDNLQIIDEVAPNTKKRGMWLLTSLFRELFRVLFIFVPVIALIGGLYALLSQTAAMLLPNTPGIFNQFIICPPLSLRHETFLAATAVRLLLMGMCCIFLIQEFTSSSIPYKRSGWARIYWVIIATFLGLLYVSPMAKHLVADNAINLYYSFCALSPLGRLGALLAAAITLSLLSLASKVLRSAWARSGKAIANNKGKTILLIILAAIAIYFLNFRGPHDVKIDAIRIFFLPTFLRWRTIFKWSVLFLLAYIVRGFLTSAIGCLAVYLGADALSHNFAARSQILHECTQQILALVDSPEADFTYDKVLIAAHSLGSVIAYDSLNELTVRKHARDADVVSASLFKLTGLLTFGSPLNKVIYFFRTRTSLQTNVLSQILYALHPFRLRTELPPGANPVVSLPHPFPPNGPFEQLHWLNAYSPFDLISGRMLFFRADKDIAVEHGVTPWTAHLSYWENNALYSLFSKLL